MARRRGKTRGAEEEHENAERWLLTYADMITLLMVLFIVLFAIGQVDQKKFAKLHDGLAKSFGESSVLDGGAGMLDGSAVQADAPDQAQMGTQMLARQDEAALAAQAAAQAAQKAGRGQPGPRGDHQSGAGQGGPRRRPWSSRRSTSEVCRSTSSPTSCSSTSARRRCGPKGVEVLSALAPVLRKLPNQLVIEGHTDSQPISDAQLPLELGAVHGTGHHRPALPAQAGGRPLDGLRRGLRRPAAPGPRDERCSNARNRRVAIVIVADPTTVRGHGRT